MKLGDKKRSAFTRIEVVMVVAIVALLALLIHPPSRVAKEKARSAQCIFNLRQIELGYKTWAIDQNPDYVMARSTNWGGSREYVLADELGRHYREMSNEIAEINYLICPSDNRFPAKSFADLQNTNISYFVGVDASDNYPQTILCGDRNIRSEQPVVKSILTLYTNSPINWTADIHNNRGTIGLADGSVQAVTNTNYFQLVYGRPYPTNRLVLPE